MSAANARQDGLGVTVIRDLQNGTVALAINIRLSTKRRAQHHRAKLSNDQVRQMRREYRAFVFGYEKSAAKHGCGISTARDIITYRTRKDVI